VTKLHGDAKKRGKAKKKKYGKKIHVIEGWEKKKKGKTKKAWAPPRRRRRGGTQKNKLKKGLYPWFVIGRGRPEEEKQSRPVSVGNFSGGKKTKGRGGGGDRDTQAGKIGGKNWERHHNAKSLWMEVGVTKGVRKSRGRWVFGPQKREWEKSGRGRLPRRTYRGRRKKTTMEHHLKKLTVVSSRKGEIKGGRGYRIGCQNMNQ